MKKNKNKTLKPMVQLDRFETIEKMGLHFENKGYDSRPCDGLTVLAGKHVIISKTLTVLMSLNFCSRSCCCIFGSAVKGRKGESISQILVLRTWPYS